MNPTRLSVSVRPAIPVDMSSIRRRRHDPTIVRFTPGVDTDAAFEIVEEGDEDEPDAGQTRVLMR